MSARTIRIKKEARALFWPWCAVMVAAALPLALNRQYPILEGILINQVCFLIGIPLLAALSLGNEFQHRTLSLLLSQPVSRMAIWREKMSVMVIAVLSVAVVSSYSRYAVLVPAKFHASWDWWVIPNLWPIVTICSAMFWTLVARSTIGAVAFNLFVPLLAGLIQQWTFIFIRTNSGRVLGPNPPMPLGTGTTGSIIYVVLTLCYAGGMLWLGARKLARFQATGGVASEDLLLAGPKMPESLAGSFRCRPTEPTLNLVRKELRLLRPLWLVVLIFTFYSFCLAITIRFIPGTDASMYESLLHFVSVLYVFGVGILAGALSLGEERTSGMQSWHLTLPVPARRQWLIKLGTAFSMSFVCGVVVPVVVMTAGQLILGSSPLRFFFPHGFSFPHDFSLLRIMASPLLALALILALFTFPSFWCACVVKGTMRAVLWVFPVMSALVLVGRFGWGYGQEIAQSSGTLRELVAAWFHLDPFAFVGTLADVNLMYWLAAPTLLLAMVQSYRLFRTEPQDSILWVVRRLLPLALMAFVCSFSLCFSGLPPWMIAPRGGSGWHPLHETAQAVRKFEPTFKNLDAAHPLQLTLGDLNKVYPLTSLTRRWLRNSSITVAPGKAHAVPVVTIHLASGLDCRVTNVDYSNGFHSGPLCVHRSP